MKKFIRDIFLFTSLLVSLLALLKKSVPFHWGNPQLASKLDHVINSEEKYDVLFFGSSAVFRHIDPLVFDSVAGSNSFNLGFTACFFNETHYLIEHFIKNYELKDKDSVQIFRSDTVPRIMRERVLHTTRNNYFMDFKRWKMAMQRHGWNIRDKQCHLFSIAFLENLLCVGQIRGILKHHIFGNEKLKSIVADQKGYYGFDQEIELEGDKPFLKHHKNHIKSEKFRTGQNMTFDEIDDYSFNLSNDKPKTYPIYISNKPFKFIQMPWTAPFGPKYEYDGIHLNEKGAKIFSKKLGEAYLKYTDYQ